ARISKIAGWYRECGIIPHTYDVDFAAFIDEYNPQLLEHLRSNETKFFLNRKFGRANDSFEFTLRPLGGGRPMMDLFWMYNSANESWVGGTSRDGTKYKYSYPKIVRICAGELLGHIFWVPCDPETIITVRAAHESFHKTRIHLCFISSSKCSNQNDFSLPKILVLKKP
ncbi:hypothetical protein ANCCAN_01185, partial [Ancylostoma caninum]